MSLAEFVGVALAVFTPVVLIWAVGILVIFGLVALFAALVILAFG